MGDVSRVDKTHDWLLINRPLDGSSTTARRHGEFSKLVVGEQLKLVNDYVCTSDARCFARITALNQGINTDRGYRIYGLVDAERPNRRAMSSSSH